MLKCLVLNKVLIFFRSFVLIQKNQKIKASSKTKIHHVFPKMQELVSLKRVANSDSLHFLTGNHDEFLNAIF